MLILTIFGTRALIVRIDRLVGRGVLHGARRTRRQPSALTRTAFTIKLV
jgi:hypothetical protein